MAITQKDIAEQMGVSRSLVGLALSNHPRVSKEMRRKVRETAVGNATIRPYRNMVGKYYFGSYGCNFAYQQLPTGQASLFRNEETSAGGTPQAPTVDASLEAPSTTVALMDTYAYDSYYPWMNSTSPTIPAVSATGVTGNRHMGNVEERHLETLNVLWADGHVKSVKLSTLATIGDNGRATYWTVNADPN